MEAVLHWSLDSRGQDGQARDNLIWGRDGWAQGDTSRNVGISGVGFLDNPSYFQLRIQVMATNCQELLGKPQGDAHIHGVSGSPRLLKTD